MHTGEKASTEYLVACGLAKKKPFFSTFFKPFVDALQETEIHGKLQSKYIMEIKNKTN